MYRSLSRKIRRVENTSEARYTGELRAVHIQEPLEGEQTWLLEEFRQTVYRGRRQCGLSERSEGECATPRWIFYFTKI